jgi:hypothetical protein
LASSVREPDAKAVINALNVQQAFWKKLYSGNILFIPTNS